MCILLEPSLLISLVVLTKLERDALEHFSISVCLEIKLTHKLSIAKDAVVENIFSLITFLFG